MKLAPIVLFVYNRPKHTALTIEALQKNELASDSDLIIFSDAPKTEAQAEAVSEVRKYIQTIQGFKSIEIIFQEKNKGLADSIIDGVTHVVNQYGRIIVLEDDIVTSPYFLSFMNQALDFYREHCSVFSISGYNHPNTLMHMPASYHFDVYFNPRNTSWGWATWQEKWLKADWELNGFLDFSQNQCLVRAFNQGGDDLSDMLNAQYQGILDSWAIRWAYSHFKHHAVSVWPIYSYVDNIGMDGSGIHCGLSSKHKNDLTLAKAQVEFLDYIFCDEKVMQAFRKVYQKPSRMDRVMRRAKNFAGTLIGGYDR